MAIFQISSRSNAVTILSGPSFVPATNAPLAGILQLATDVASRIKVVVSDGTDTWQRGFYDFTTNHEVPLYGFKPDRTNMIQVTVYDEYRNAYSAPQSSVFVTAPLPANFAHFTVLTSERSQMEPGDTLFHVYNLTDDSAYLTILDNSGQVVWYRPALQSIDINVRQLDDGNLFIQEPPPANDFVEINLLGDTVRTWNVPAGYPVNGHDAFPTGRGTILYLSDVSEVVSNFPSILPKDSTNANPPLETVTVDDNPVVEISITNGALLHVWSPVQLLDPTRVTYLTADHYSSYGLDTEHANAIFEDTNDDSIIVSQRDENTIYKFSRSTGQLIWILAPHANWPTNFQRYLLTPVGAPFEWCYGQHAPELTPQGTLLVFDDGPDRASPFDPPVPDADNYSRVVEYGIDETNMTITQVWDSYDSGEVIEDRLFAALLGKADWLPQRHDILATYGWINYVNGVQLSPSNAIMARIVEFTHDPLPQVVFDLSIWDYNNTNVNYRGYFCYRSDRIPDLYAHPALPVTDLALSDPNQTPRLEFSADPAHSYIVQASTNLLDWATIGSAVQEAGDIGEFDFDDLDTNQFVTRFYRVVTQ